MEKFNYSNIFIIIGLPKTTKAFVFRFLKIVLNTKGINLICNNKSDKDILLKAYLILVIINEVNNFIKRYFNIKIKSYLGKMPKIDNNYNEREKQLIEIIFDNEIIYKGLNMEQAKYILDIKNWAKLVYEFKNEFSKINNRNQDYSIIFFD